VRRTVVFFRQLLLPFHNFPGKADDHIVFTGLAANRDRAECGILYRHDLNLYVYPPRRANISMYRNRIEATSRLWARRPTCRDFLQARTNLDELLDEALEGTFPASDPIALAVELETMESESQGHRKGSKRGTYAQVSRQLRSTP
jgi:hypothetical protein